MMSFRMSLRRSEKLRIVTSFSCAKSLVSLDVNNGFLRAVPHTAQPVNQLFYLLPELFLLLSINARRYIGREESARRLQQNRRDAVLLWQQEPRRRWTTVLIPKVKPWRKKKRRGNGYFRAYIRKMWKAPPAQCLYCLWENDDVQHSTRNMACSFRDLKDTSPRRQV